MRVSCLESTEWGRCEAIEREHGGLPSEKLRQEYHQRSRSVRHAMRSFVGRAINHDRQAAIERDHGGRCRSVVGITRNVAEAFEAFAITSFVGTCHQSWQVCSP